MNVLRSGPILIKKILLLLADAKGILNFRNPENSSRRSSVCHTYAATVAFSPCFVLGSVKVSDQTVEVYWPAES